MKKVSNIYNLIYYEYEFYSLKLVEKCQLCGAIYSEKLQLPRLHVLEASLGLSYGGDVDVWLQSVSAVNVASMYKVL